MAKKSFVGIKTPWFPETYMAPEIDKTLTKEGAVADAAAVGKALEDKVSVGLFTKTITVDNKSGTKKFWAQIEEVYAKMADHTIEYVCCYCHNLDTSDQDEPRVGGVWVAEVYRSDEKYGFVSARTYHITTSLGVIQHLVRSWYNGEWKKPYYLHEINSIESADYPGCYYRHVNGVQEWINPPMLDGVEYRTTKRHNGEVVYSYTKDFALSGRASTGWQNSESIKIGIPASAKIVLSYCNHLDDSDFTLCRQFPLFSEGAIQMDCQLSNLKATLFPDQEDNYLITVEGAPGVTFTGKVRIFAEYTK